MKLFLKNDEIRGVSSGVSFPSRGGEDAQKYPETGDTHQPCSELWAANSQMSFPCNLWHGCNLEHGHAGPHRCWCGDTHAQDKLPFDEKGKG